VFIVAPGLTVRRSCRQAGQAIIIPNYYYPGFLINLDNGKTLVLETKGQDSSLVQEKRRALAEWIDVDGIIEKHIG
jgi:hypothetical protein